MSTVNLLKQQLKHYLSRLPDKQIFKFLEAYLNQNSLKLERSIKQISDKCFECTCKINRKSATSYGYSQIQATINSLKMIISLIIDDERQLPLINESLKKIGYNFVQQIMTQMQKKKQTTPSYFHPTSIKKGKKIQINKLINQSTEKIKKNSTISQNNSKNENKSNNKNYLSQSLIQNQKTIEYQLNIANSYIKQLENKLSQVNSQNNFLKEKLNQIISPQKNNIFKATTIKNSNFINTLVNTNKSYIPELKQIQNKGQQSLINNSISKQFLQPHKNSNQKKIPRLKLHKLPNYHGKSNKSLNQSLFEAYQKNKR